MENSNGPNPTIEHCIHVVSAVSEYKKLLDKYVDGIWLAWRNKQPAQDGVWMGLKSYFTSGETWLYITYTIGAGDVEIEQTLTYDIKNQIYKDHYETRNIKARP